MSSRPRYVCVHGHFYQPPRENPWLEVVERQDSAAPYHDWNARVHAECYAPNAAARMLDGQGRITRIVNNYESISFNFGPTLLSWMEHADPETYRAILAADRAALDRFGAGSAMAQTYGHMILPLANARDKRTQVLWGIRDFEVRFGRRPRGMWLAETACDTATLEALAAHGIEFTVLAPHQCARVRQRKGGTWQDVSGARVDGRRAYEIELPSGRKIAVFFYDGPISRAVAFERLLDNGSSFARRIVSSFTDHPEPQLAHIATDGETYGHHHRFGEMALAYALSVFEKDAGIELTTYEAFLDRHPPEWQAEIVENTSWSCAHGLERWRSDCGCRAGGPAHWNQAWRAPLRRAFDWFRDELGQIFEHEARTVLADPWAARDAYIEVVLDRSEASVRRFWAAHARSDRGDQDLSRALSLLEMQRHAMLMYTSCGWFFDDLSGIETVQVIHYAARALQLAETVDGAGIQRNFLARLREAKSNRAEAGDGERIYEERVRPQMVQLRNVGAHYAASSLFENYREREQLFGYEIDSRVREVSTAGSLRLLVGRAEIKSRVTWQREDIEYAVVHLGDHNLTGGVRLWESEPAHAGLRAELQAAFSRADLTELLRVIERQFPSGGYSLRSLFRDEQKKILDDVLSARLSEVERDYELIYGRHAALMRYLASLSQPVPRSLHQAAEYTLSARLRRELERGGAVDLEAAQAIVNEAKEAGVMLALGELGAAVQRTLETLIDALATEPDDGDGLARAARIAAFAARAGLRYDASRAQNRFYVMRETVYPVRRVVLASDDPWLAGFRELGAQLGVTVD